MMDLSRVAGWSIVLNHEFEHFYQWDRKIVFKYPTSPANLI